MVQLTVVSRKNHVAARKMKELKNRGGNKQEKPGAKENEGGEKVSLNVEDINDKNEIPASDEKQAIQGEEQVEKMADNDSVI
ncbi:hypothetical protein A2U01_0017872 [Trifolium medium]|uniref:Uncharacterized protein n=1 Tax=Trifolium medium TaxID=97028 RepID=A0A392NBN4_9FABA|nr:hypothetical protein [Trifolium medium]